MLDVVWLIPALPLAGFADHPAVRPPARRPEGRLPGDADVRRCVRRRRRRVLRPARRKSAEERQHVAKLFTWVPVGSLKVDLAFLADPLSITMCLFVTGIGTLIHLYAIGYMHGDPKFSKFFLYLNLFVFSMLMLVLGENLLVTFLGWEGVGTCSYFLISFWHERESAATAGKKAFVTNRVGDWGFMLAMFFAFQATGTLSYIGDQRRGVAPWRRRRRPRSRCSAFIGAVRQERAAAAVPVAARRDGRPDAGVGADPRGHDGHRRRVPDVRISPMLDAASSYAPTLIAIVGVATALFAATIAVAQNDIKKVLAYSTVSQLGYMFLAVGSGAYIAAIFHMVTHAFFKALLFLGSGSVIHGMHDEQDMRRMGALRKVMPITAATFIVGWLAIAGVPPFAGFWSKDEILLAAYDKSPVLWVVGLVTALLTAYYMTRQVIMVFYGEARWDDARTKSTARTATSSRTRARRSCCCRSSCWPVCRSSAAGINLPFNAHTEKLSQWLEPVHRSARERHGEGAAWRSIATVDRAARHRRVDHGVRQAQGQADRAGGARRRLVLRRGRQRRSWAAPVARRFEAVAWFDANVIDGAVNGVGRVVRGTGAAHPHGADRQRAQLRGGHRRRRRAAAGVVRRRAGQPVISFPILTMLVLVPAVGALAGRRHSPTADPSG